MHIYKIKLIYNSSTQFPTPNFTSLLVHMGEWYGEQYTCPFLYSGDKSQTPQWVPEIWHEHIAFKVFPMWPELAA